MFLVTEKKESIHYVCRQQQLTKPITTSRVPTPLRSGNSSELFMINNNVIVIVT